MSHSAMSIPLIAFMTTPRLPYWRVRANISCHNPSINSGSRPTSSGLRSRSMTAAVAPPPTPASPRPTVPSSVSTSTNSAPRRACRPEALAYGGSHRYDSAIVRMSAIFIARLLIPDHREQVALDLHRRGEVAAGDRVPRRAGMRVGKHLDPVFVHDRAQRAVGDPDIHLDDVISAAAGGLDDPPHIGEHRRALRFEVGRHR